MQREKRNKVLEFSRLNVLIVINIVVFLLINITAQHNAPITQTVYSYLALPAPLHLLLTRCWTLLTYMFVYNGFLNVIFGMLWLYWVGSIFEDFVGGKKLLSLYLLGGIGGALFFLVAYNLFPVLWTSVGYAGSAGAAACVMAVVVGTATLVPDYSVSLVLFGTTSLKRVAMIYVVIDLLFSQGPYGNEAVTHVGGGLAGFFYVYQLQHGNDLGDWVKSLFHRRSKLSIVSKGTGKFSNAKPRQDEIDRILDKISQTGYDSLNKQEKETLFRASSDDKS